MGRIDPATYNLFLILIGVCFVVGAFWVIRLQRELAEESEVVTEADRLKELERAFYAGEMSREEFETVRRILQPDAAPSKPPVAAPQAGKVVDPNVARLRELERAFYAGELSREELDRVREILNARGAAASAQEPPSTPTVPTIEVDQ